MRGPGVCFKDGGEVSEVAEGCFKDGGEVSEGAEGGACDPVKHTGGAVWGSWCQHSEGSNMDHPATLRHSAFHIPRTLHPAPCTLHPVPCNPVPCTLHPAPYNLQPGQASSGQTLWGGSDTTPGIVACVPGQYGLTAPPLPVLQHWPGAP